MEKIFGIHTDNFREKYHRSHLKFLYDIVMIYHYSPSWILERELLTETSNFNYVYYRWHRGSCRSAITGPILLVPKNDIIRDKYRSDWKDIGRLFKNRKEPFTFNYLIDELWKIESIINAKL